MASVDTEGGRVVGVTTRGGQRVQCDHVVNACGMWARQLAAQNGIHLPLQAAEHYYLITDKMPEVDPTWPVVEDPASFAYIRPEGGGMMVGLFEVRNAMNAHLAHPGVCAHFVGWTQWLDCARVRDLVYPSR